MQEKDKNEAKHGSEDSDDQKSRKTDFLEIGNVSIKELDPTTSRDRYKIDNSQIKHKEAHQNLDFDATKKSKTKNPAMARKNWKRYSNHEISKDYCKDRNPEKYLNFYEKKDSEYMSLSKQQSNSDKKKDAEFKELVIKDPEQYSYKIKKKKHFQNTNLLENNKYLEQNIYKKALFFQKIQDNKNKHENIITLNDIFSNTESVTDLRHQKNCLNKENRPYKKYSQFTHYDNSNFSILSYTDFQTSKFYYQKKLSRISKSIQNNIVHNDINSYPYSKSEIYSPMTKKFTNYSEKDFLKSKNNKKIEDKENFYRNFHVPEYTNNSNNSDGKKENLKEAYQTEFSKKFDDSNKSFTNTNSINNSSESNKSKNYDNLSRFTFIDNAIASIYNLHLDIYCTYFKKNENHILMSHSLIKAYRTCQNFGVKVMIMKFLDTMKRRNHVSDELSKNIKILKNIQNIFTSEKINSLCSNNHLSYLYHAIILLKQKNFDSIKQILEKIIFFKNFIKKEVRKAENEIKLKNNEHTKKSLENNSNENITNINDNKNLSSSLSFYLVNTYYLREFNILLSKYNHLQNKESISDLLEVLELSDNENDISAILFKIATGYIEEYYRTRKNQNISLLNNSLRIFEKLKDHFSDFKALIDIYIQIIHVYYLLKLYKKAQNLCKYILKYQIKLKNKLNQNKVNQMGVLLYINILMENNQVKKYTESSDKEINSENNIELKESENNPNKNYTGSTDKKINSNFESNIELKESENNPNKNYTESTDKEINSESNIKLKYFHKSDKCIKNITLQESDKLDNLKDPNKHDKSKVKRIKSNKKDSSKSTTPNKSELDNQKIIFFKKLRKSINLLSSNNLKLYYLAYFYYLKGNFKKIKKILKKYFCNSDKCNSLDKYFKNLKIFNLLIFDEFEKAKILANKNVDWNVGQKNYKLISSNLKIEKIKKEFFVPKPSIEVPEIRNCLSFEYFDDDSF